MNPRVHSLFLLLCLLLVACIAKEIPPPLEGTVPFKVLVHFSSDLPNPYYVLSGPFQSYQHFAVNESFQHRLEAYAEAKSDPRASQTLELTVHVTKLQTSYDRLGILPEGKRPRVLLAGVGWPLTAFDSIDQDHFDDLPEQITKTAALTAEVGITLPGQAEIRESIVGRSVQILERWDMDLGTYDYSPLIREVQTVVIRDIDRMLHRSLPGAVSGRSQP